jgi:hypothetical protein
MLIIMDYLFVISRIMNIKNIISNPYVSKKNFYVMKKIILLILINKMKMKI